MRNLSALAVAILLLFSLFVDQGCQSGPGGSPDCPIKIPVWTIVEEDTKDSLEFLAELRTLAEKQAAGDLLRAPGAVPLDYSAIFKAAMESTSGKKFQISQKATEQVTALTMLECSIWRGTYTTPQSRNEAEQLLLKIIGEMVEIEANAPAAQPVSPVAAQVPDLSLSVVEVGWRYQPPPETPPGSTYAGPMLPIPITIELRNVDMGGATNEHCLATLRSHLRVKPRPVENNQPVLNANNKGIRDITVAENVPADGQAESSSVRTVTCRFVVTLHFSTQAANVLFSDTLGRTAVGASIWGRPSE